MKPLKIKCGILTLIAMFIFALPSYSENLQNGIDLYNAGQYEKAIEILKIIIITEPKSPEPHLWLSKCYEATFDLEKLIKEKKIYEYLKAEYDYEKLKTIVVKPTPKVQQSETPEAAKADNNPPIIINNEKIKEYQKPDFKTPVSNESKKNASSETEIKSPVNTSEKKDSGTDNKSKDLTEILSSDNNKEFTYFKCFAFSTDSKYIAAGHGYGGEVTIRDFAGKEIKYFKAHDKEVLQITYSPNGKYLITGGFDKKIKIWETGTNKVVRSIDTERELKTLAVSPDGIYVTADGFSKIQLWNIQTGKNISPVKERVPVGYMRFNPKLSYLASANSYGNGSLSNEVSIWDINSGKRLHLLKHPLQSMSLAYSPDGKFLAANSWQNIVIWNSAGVIVKTIESKLKDTIMALAYSPDGKLLASGTQDGTRHAVITLWETKGYNPVKTFSIDRYGVEEIHFSPDGKYLAARGYGNVIWLWKL